MGNACASSYLLALGLSLAFVDTSTKYFTSRWSSPLNYIPTSSQVLQYSIAM